MVAVLGKRKRTAADAWIEALDPLNGLSIAQARNVYNAARRHGSPLLQKMYDEIEAGDPVLMTCVDRRQSALAGLGWRTVANASARDPALAEEQRAALEEFANGIEDLDEAIEHLGLGFFRGFSVCQPVWEGNAVRHIELLDGWNFLRGDNGALLWNPECSMDPAKCEEITPAARLVAFRRRRAIDWPALTIYIRMHIGERDWGRFLERYGIPPVNAIMAPGSNKETRADYVECVEASHDGRSTAWPSGSQISYAEGARGQDPFTRFVEHQEKLVVLMATGGTLTSLAQADTGSLAGGAQMDVWTQIVARDGVSISAALNRNLFWPFLRAAFPGRPVAARLELGHEDEPTAAEAAEMAGKLRTAGYRVDQSQLEEATGYKLEREESAPGTGGMGPGGVWNAERPRQGVAEPLQNSRTGAGATTVPPGEKPPSAGILEPSVPDAAATGLARAMQRDLRPAARIIAEALRTHDWKAARKQLADTLKECGTESAEALEREMRAAGEKACLETHAEAQSGGGAEGVANSECRAKDPAHCRTHGTPEGKKEKGNMPRNDGKIHFGSGVAREKADGQSKDLGYAGIDDLMQKSTGVEQATIDSILGGGSEPCEPHEAVAALRTCASIPSGVEGEPAVKLGERPLRHYICGEGRHHGGEPDVKRLKTLPQAIQAIRHPDSYHHELNQKPIVKFPGESLPKGAQTVYQYKAGKTFAYADSGVLTGWQNY